MKNLVLKDMKLLGVFNILFLGLPLVLGYISTLPEENYHAILIYIFAALVPIYILIIRMSINDMTSNVNPLLVSLPVKRLDIVKSRYVSIFIYTFLISVLVFLSSNISRALLGSQNESTFTLTSMLFTVSLVVLFLSVNIPFQYHDARKTQIFNSLFYAALILAPNILGKLNIDLSNNIIQKILSLDFTVLAPGLLAISLIIYVGSLFISKTIYSRKEF